MGKKAQGLSLNTIIIAIIVLIVLVVIIMVFTGYFGTRFTPGVTSCENSGGTCQTPVDEEDPCGFDAFGNEIPTLQGACQVQGKVCCSKGLGVGVKEETCGPLKQKCAGGTACVNDACVDECNAPKACLALASCAAGTSVTPTECDARDSSKVCCTRAAAQ